MERRLAARLGGALATLAVTSVVVFTLMTLLPGDAAMLNLGVDATPETLAAARRALGLDESAAWRYLAWIASLARGDLGVSATYHVPVATLIAERLAVTLPLGALALSLSLTLGGGAALAMARRPGGAVDVTLGILARLLLAVPSFWLGLILVLIFAVDLGWFPAGGFPGWSDRPLASALALIPPAVAVALPLAAVMGLVGRDSLIGVGRRDFTRTARAKGLDEGAVLRRHILRHAMIPMVTLIGLQAGYLVGGTVVVETVFSLPGLGRLAVQAAQQRDLTVVEDLALLLSGLVILVNAGVDLAYAWIDPRLSRA